MKPSVLILVAFIFARAAPLEAAITDNLVAYYDLAEASGNAIDAFSDHDLAETDGTIGAYSENGIAARELTRADTECFRAADATWNRFNGGSFTFMLQCKAKTWPTSGFVVLMGKDGASHRAAIIDYNSSSKRFELIVSKNGTDSDTIVASSYGEPPANAWITIFAWYNAAADTINISVNDGTVNSKTYAEDDIHTGVSSDTFNIGATFGATPAHTFDGYMRRCAVWKRPLEADERTFLFNNTHGRSFSQLSVGAARHNYQQQ